MAKTTIKWLSHAGFQITSPGGKILYIDPWFENPISSFGIQDVKEAALVLVTHDHFDHFDPDAIAAGRDAAHPDHGDGAVTNSQTRRPILRSIFQRRLLGSRTVSSARGRGDGDRATISRGGEASPVQRRGRTV